jgi:hypothetical protein
MTEQAAKPPALTRIFNTPIGDAWVEFELLPPDLPIGHQVTVNWVQNGQPKRYTGIVQMKTTEIRTFGTPPVLSGRVFETVFLDANRCATVTITESTPE